MPEPREKIPGDRIRYFNHATQKIEDDWQLIRFEPSSGNAVIGRETTRLNIERDVFYKLNFPGSDDVYFSLRRAASRDPEAEEALAVWAKGDFKALKRSLVAIICRSAPVFSGIQNAADLSKKLVQKEEGIDRALSILKLEKTRAEREYNNFVARTSFENDGKDNLLLRLRNFEDQYATKLFERSSLLPVWQGYFRALAALEAKMRS